MGVASLPQAPRHKMQAQPAEPPAERVSDRGDAPRRGAPGVPRMRDGAGGVRGGAAPSRTAQPGSRASTTAPIHGSGLGRRDPGIFILETDLTYRNRGTYDPSMSPLTFTPPPGETVEDLDPGSYAAWEFYRDNTPNPWLSLWDWIEQNPAFAEYYAAPVEPRPEPAAPTDGSQPLPDYLLRELPRMCSGMPADPQPAPARA